MDIRKAAALWICLCVMGMTVLAGCGAKDGKEPAEDQGNAVEDKASTEASEVAAEENATEENTAEENTAEAVPDIYGGPEADKEVEGFVTVYSDDKGLSTKVPENYETIWENEEDYWGGLYVYPGKSGEFPSALIRRYENIDVSAADFLQNEYTAFMKRNTDGSYPVTLSVLGDVKEYDIGGMKLPGIEYEMAFDEGGTVHKLSLATKVKAKSTGEDVLVYIDGKYLKGDEAGEELAMTVLDYVTRYFMVEDTEPENEEIKPAPDDSYKAATDVTGPDYETFTAGDGTFSTKYEKSRSAEWLDPEGYWGGIGIYPNPTDAYPYNQVRIYEYVSVPPEEFLLEEYLQYIYRLEDMTGRIEVTDAEGPYEYDIAGSCLPGMLYTIKQSDGSIYKQLVLADRVKDGKTGKVSLVQFCAGYFTDDEADKTWAMEGLDAAVRGFSLE